MSPEDFAKAAGVSHETLEIFVKYQLVIQKWQRSIKLVGPSALGDIWQRHFLDSAQLYPLLPEIPGRSCLIYDLGSGAGFPGLVLAIMAQGTGRSLTVHLVESDRRKAAFLAEAARETGVGKMVAIHPVRAETLPADSHVPKADVVTARAVAPLADLVALAHPLLAPNGKCLFLKGARVEEELTALAKSRKLGKTWRMRTTRHVSRSDPAGAIIELQDIALV